MSEQTAKRIPYGSADFGRMRQDNSYYVDKTRFIPLLEAQPYFVFLIRPRRFGKTLWLSLLQHYYDLMLRRRWTIDDGLHRASIVHRLSSSCCTA